MKYSLTSCALVLMFLSFSTTALAAASESKFGNWFKSCNAEQTDQCYIHQSLVLRKGETSGIIASINAMYIATDKIMLSARFSKTALQKAGLGLKVDNHKDIRVKILNCDDQVCSTNILVDEQMKKELSNGQLLRLVYFDSASQSQATLPFSLKDFQQALDSIAPESAS